MITCKLTKLITLVLMAYLPFRGHTSDINEEVQRLLKLLNSIYKSITRIENEAQWKAITDVNDKHIAASIAASEAAAAFRGDAELIRLLRHYLDQKDQLDPIVVRQLERFLLEAGDSPMTNPTLVAERVKAEANQAAIMNSFTFRIGERLVTPNEIDQILQSSTNLSDRLEAWLASKEIGPVLKPGLIQLRYLRNMVVKELGFDNYFAFRAAAYGMSSEEILKMQYSFLKVLWPLYAHLHCWAKHELAKKYAQAVPKLIPAHWINNRWAQEWSGLVEGINLDSALSKRSPQWIISAAENYFISMGLDPLPKSVWDKSDLLPVPAGSARKKNTHASCWHIDLEHDIRVLLNLEPTSRWFFTTYHELGHAYYDYYYTKEQIPPILRSAPCPAFHEAMAMLAEFGASQPSYLHKLGLIENEPDLITMLLDQALQVVPFMFWASGVMTHWEYDLYVKNLAPDQWNRVWWEYVEKFQGVKSPTDRGEEYCDGATKTHINDAPCYYYSYAIAMVIKFQLHYYIARHILRESPYKCNYAENKAVGLFLKDIMEKGATIGWRQLIKEVTGEEISVRPMVEYFRPLLEWLQQQNSGRKVGWEGAWFGELN